MNSLKTAKNIHKKTVEKIREFNRFYTIITGILNSQYVKSDFSAIEARILLEINTGKNVSQNFLVKTLNIDKSYLSRIVKRFIKLGLVEKTVSKDDARACNLNLTKYGQKTFEKLVDATNKQINEMISPLTFGECEKLIESLNNVVKYFKKGEKQ